MKSEERLRQTVSDMEQLHRLLETERTKAWFEGAEAGIRFALDDESTENGAMLSRVLTIMREQFHAMKAGTN